LPQAAVEGKLSAKEIHSDQKHHRSPDSPKAKSGVHNRGPIVFMGPGLGASANPGMGADVIQSAQL
jgi:hypothetical protein